MKTMEDYTIYCTKEQTRIAYELGAPIGITLNAYENGVQLASLCDNKYLWAVTTQQMIGWLREKGIRIVCGPNDDYFVFVKGFEMLACSYNNELAAIDRALNYLLEKGE